jgi:hypothetical protein
MCFACTILGFWVVGKTQAGVQHRRSYLAATLIGAGVGLIKELGDGMKWWAGRVSARDILADGFGIFVAVGILAGSHLGVSTEFVNEPTKSIEIV